MKKITKKLITNYDLTIFCFMGYRFKKGFSNATFHHIVPKNKKGERCPENGAVLTKTAHEYFNTIELVGRRYHSEDIIYSQELNKLFLYINKSQYKPTIDTITQIYSILNEFEKKYQGKLNEFGRPIIRPKFITERVGFDEIDNDSIIYDDEFDGIDNDSIICDDEFDEIDKEYKEYYEKIPEDDDDDLYLYPFNKKPIQRRRL